MFGEGNFKYLYTFEEVKKIYKLDTSTLRKKIKRGELIDGVDVKKFGGTWLITQQSLIKHFGKNKLKKYLEKNVFKPIVFNIGNGNDDDDDLGEIL